MSRERHVRVFGDRRDAGRALGERLAAERPPGELLVLALPRGGVPVAHEVARILNAPLDVYLVRKLGAPGNPEYALGAIASGGVVVYNEEALRALDLGETDVAPIIERERAELGRRERAYRGARPALPLAGKTVIIVDDGIATGSTMRAAVAAAKASDASRVVVGAPTASREAVDALARSADGVVALTMPDPYLAVGESYAVFDQLEDEQVLELLRER